MSTVYEVQLPSEQYEVCQQLCQRLASGAALGVCLQGNRLTMRWSDPDRKLLQVSTIIEDVITPRQIEQERAADQRMKLLCERIDKIVQKATRDKFFSLRDELDMAETGEIPQ